MEVCHGKTPAEIQSFMMKSIGSALEVDAQSLDPAAPFTSYGLDSIAAFTMTVELAEWLDCELPASLFWEFTTVSDLANHLATFSGE